MSVDLENALMTHDAVLEAAVITVPHEKWLERPLACVLLHEGQIADDDMKEKLLSYMEGQFAKWWVPDDVVFLDEIPKTSVGKFLKMALRRTNRTVRGSISLGHPFSLGGLFN